MTNTPNTSLEHIYRPDELGDIYGQGPTISAIEAILDREEIPQTLCFHGHTGCGKTTAARIVARLLKCENPTELNISDTRGIDQARKINRTVKLAPLSGGSRVIILNECHKATKDFWNALLEVLEEPPNGTFFILCTTELDKLIETVRGRCKQFKFNPLKKDVLIDLMRDVLEKEKVEFSKKHIRSIASAANGSARVALSLLDSVLDLDDDDEITAFIKGSNVDDSEIIELCRAIINVDKWSTVTSSLKSFKDQGKNAEGIRIAIARYFDAVIKGNKKLPEPNLILAASFFSTDTFMYTEFPALTIACAEALRALSD